LFRTGHDCGRHPYQPLVVDAVGYVPLERPAANMLSVLAPTTRAVLIVRSLSKPLRVRDKSWNSIPPSAQRNPPICRYFGMICNWERLLAMQKVVASNPVSRFEESPVFAGLFAFIGGPSGPALEPFSAPESRCREQLVVAKG
jgi:hypothetical protein